MELILIVQLPGPTYQNQLQTTRWWSSFQGGNDQEHLSDDPQVLGQDLVGLPGQPGRRHLRLADY